MNAELNELREEVNAALEAQQRRNDDSWMHENPDEIGLPITWADDYPSIKAPQTVVAGLIEAGSLCVAFGEANAGKSTVILDMALAIARGVPWRGRPTRRGIVLWLALESAAGLRRRVAAYRLQHNIPPDEVLLLADITAGVRLLDVQDVQAIQTSIRIAELVKGEKCRLVVIDTLARALAGGDENDGRDMSTLIRGCDMIRQETGATVLLIHHSGKDTTRGARGHSSLRAAVDTEIEVSGQQNPRQARVTKQRDLPSGDVFAFDLEPVEIEAASDEHEPVSACVVVHRDDVSAALRRPIGRNQQLLLAAVRERVRATGSPLIATPDLREIAKAQGLTDRRRFSEARESLERDGWLVATVGGYRLEGDRL